MEGVVKVFGNSVITELMMRPSHSSTEPLQHATIAVALVEWAVKSVDTPAILNVSLSHRATVAGVTG